MGRVERYRAGARSASTDEACGMAAFRLSEHIFEARTSESGPEWKSNMDEVAKGYSRSRRAQIDPDAGADFIHPHSQNR
jgi:hypothetical protein